MNNRINVQRGDASVVVLIVLVVALIGVLGYVAWQNFGQKDEAVVSDQKADETTTAPESNEVVALTEWGVEVPLGSSGLELTAAFEDSYYYLTAAVEGCDVIQGNAGAITRYGSEDDVVLVGDPDSPRFKAYEGKTWADVAADPEAGTFVTVDGIVYGLDSPQATSCEDSGDAELANFNIVRDDLFPALRAKS